MKIRLAQPSDAERLLAIYAPYVTNTTITFEYSVPTVAEFRQRITDTLTAYPYLVAENDHGIVLGYAYAHRYRERPAYDWDAEVSIYVSREARGGGIGRQLYHVLEHQLTRQHVIHIVACITGQNSASVQFHQRLGYQLIGQFRNFGYKFHQWYDVILMQKQLGSDDRPQPFLPFSQLPTPKSH